MPTPPQAESWADVGAGGTAGTGIADGMEPLSSPPLPPLNEDAGGTVGGDVPGTPTSAKARRKSQTPVRSASTADGEGSESEQSDEGDEV